MNKKKLLKILLFLLLIIITVIYTYRIRFLVDDELFNYGFAKSIIEGLIPYKDFNMIIPPLFAYITALFLKIFGEKLIIYHIIIAIIIALITYISSEKIGKFAIIIYVLLLIYPYTGYNLFAMFLFFILLNLKENDKKNIYLEPIIISLIILTKHTLGLLVIPSLIYSKNRLKTFLIYLVSFFCLLLYLIINNNLFEFINYTILGMFDFTTNNGTNINFLFIIELIIIAFLIYNAIKTKKKEYFYVLMFQIVTFPIVNYVHFMISFIPFVYLLFLKYKNNFYLKWFSCVIAISFFFIFTIICIKDIEKYGLEPYPVNNFMKGRFNQTINITYVELIDNYIDEYKEYTPYIFSNLAYFIKLNLDYPINKYDLINNGNMGYKGSYKYIEEIDKNCEKNKCIFFINEYELKYGNFQTNKEILMHISQKYNKIYTTNMFNIYIN